MGFRLMTIAITTIATTAITAITMINSIVVLRPPLPVVPDVAIVMRDPADTCGPFSVAVTVSTVVPAELPAVKVVLVVVELLGEMLPTLLSLRDQVYVIVVGQATVLPLLVHVGDTVKICWPPVDTLTVVGEMAMDVRVVVTTDVVTVITVDAPTVVEPSVALTKIPPVRAVVPAVKVGVAVPEALSEPSALFETVQAYVIVPGQVELQVGVAVKDCVFPDATEGLVGPTATEVNVIAGAVTVITVDAPLTVPLRVAFTNMPSVPAVEPALKVAVVVEGVRDPRAVLERAQA